MGKTLDAEISRVFEIRPICFRGLLCRMVWFLPVRTYMNSQDTLAMSWVSCWLCSRVFEMASVTPQPQQAGEHVVGTVRCCQSLFMQSLSHSERGKKVPFYGVSLSDEAELQAMRRPAHGAR